MKHVTKIYQLVFFSLWQTKIWKIKTMHAVAVLSESCIRRIDRALETNDTNSFSLHIVEELEVSDIIKW